MIRDRGAGRRRLKLQLLKLLEKNDVNKTCSAFDDYSDHLVISTLFSALCSPVEHVRWNTVICFGRIVPVLAEKEIEEARVLMRRFLWSLNDESGGIGWGAPESLGEIMCYSDILRREYIHMLISYMTEDGDELFQDGNYLELPMLQRGMLWGVGRLCQHHREEMAGHSIIDKLAAYLSSADSTVNGLAIWSLGLLRAKPFASRIEPFLDSHDVIRIYRDNLLREVKVSFLAEEALLRMDG